jgi:allantoin racemase
MTRSAVRAARAVAPDITFEGWTSTLGPAAIEGPEDGAHAVPPLLDLVRKASDQGAEAIIIACFDDTGLAAAQKLANCPVIGLGQASYTLAALLAGPTAVITTVPEAVPVIRANIQAQGHAEQITKIVAANVRVLTLEDDPQAALREFRTSAQNLPETTRNLILGCSGAVTIVQDLQSQLALTVIDGVSAAARLSRALLSH